MQKTIRKQVISGGRASKMELTTWGAKIGADYVKQFEDLVYVAFFDNLYGIFPLSDYRSGKFAFLYSDSDNEVGKSTTWLFDDNTSLNYYSEDEGWESSYSDYECYNTSDYDSEDHNDDNICNDCKEKKAKSDNYDHDNRGDNFRIDNGDNLTEYLEDVKKRLAKCNIEIEIELKKIYILDFNIPEHKYEKTELKEYNYPYYFEAKLTFPQLIKKYENAIQEENEAKEKKEKNMDDITKKFPTGSIFRFKNNPNIKYKSIGWAESGTHIVIVPENLSKLEEMDGHFNIINVMDFNMEENIDKN